MTLEISSVTCRDRLKTLSFSVALGTLHAITGDNGAGKSTLLKAIAGLVSYDGTIFVEGIDLAKFDRLKRSQLVSYIPQAYTFPFAYTVEQFVTMGGYARGGKVDLFKHLQATDCLSFQKRPFTELSTGERQRVLIARGLATGSKILLFDEPTANLDKNHALVTWQLLSSLAESGRTILVATHSHAAVDRYCNGSTLIGPHGSEVSVACKLPATTKGSCK